MIFSTDLGELVNKEQADMAQYLDKAERDREERDKEFDKSFQRSSCQNDGAISKSRR